MRIDDLEIFLSVASCKSFSVAADNLFMSQSSVSKSIKRLEDEFGFALFVRKHTTVELTTPGTELQKYGSKLVDDYHEVIRKVQYSANISPVELVETIPHLKFNLSELFDRFHVIHSDVLLNVQHNEILEDAVNALGTYPTLVLTYRTQPFEEFYRFEPLYHDRFVAIVPKNSKYTSNKISLKELSDTPVFLTSYSIRQEIIDCCTSNGITLNFNNLTEGPRREIALRKVSNGYGVFITYKSDLAFFNLNTIKICSIQEIPKATLSLGIKKNHVITKHEQMLISMLLSYSENAQFNAGI